MRDSNVVGGQFSVGVPQFNGQVTSESLQHKFSPTVLQVPGIYSFVMAVLSSSLEWTRV